MHSLGSTVAAALRVAAPYGRRRLLRVLTVACAQGAAQAGAVLVIYLFLAVVLTGGAGPAARFDAFEPPGSGPESQRGILVIGAIAVVLLAVSAAMRVAAVRAVNGYAFGLSAWLREQLLRSVFSRPFAHHQQANAAVLADLIHQQSLQVARDLYRPLLDIVSTAIVTLFVGAALLLIDPWVTTAVIVVLLGVFAVVFTLGSQRRREIGHEMRDSGADTSREVHQTLSVARAVYAHDAAGHFIARSSDAARRHAAALTRNSVVTEAPRGFAEATLVAVVVALFAVSAAQGGATADLVPTVGTLAIAGFRLIPQVQNAFAGAAKIQTSRAALDAIAEVLDRPRTNNAQVGPELPRLTGHWRATVTLRGVGVTYAANRPAALHDVELTLRRGQSIAIVGPSGAGKTTLLEVLLGLITPDCGQVTVDGDLLTAQRGQWWRRQIGYVPQDVVLLDDTVAANVTFDANQGDEEAIWRALANAQLSDFVATELPLGLDTRVGDRGAALSGGQRQRLGLARALYRNPDLLLLDEATNHLDRENEASFLRTVAELAPDLTVVQVTHRLNPALPVDAVYRLAAGHLTRESVDVRGH